MPKLFQETDLVQTMMLLGFELERDFKYGYIRVWHKNMLMATFKTATDVFAHCFKSGLKDPDYERLDAWKAPLK